MAESFSCYLCGCHHFKSRKGAVRDNVRLKVIECIECGLVTLSSFGHIADEHYEDSGMHGDKLLSIESWLKETAEDDERRFEMCKTELVNCKVLDFGCGAAGFLRKAQGLAAEVAGIELEKRVREYWAGRIEIYEDLNAAKDGYELITAFHVVEHLSDPRRMLRDLAMHLKDGGRLIVEVPCSEDALLTLYDSDAFQHFTYWSQHIFLFNAETLRCLADQAGLQVVSIQQFQRYPLSNHLHWLSRNRPGGHQHWSFLDTPELTRAYAASLAAVGKCDTVIAYLEQE